MLLEFTRTRSLFARGAAAAVLASVAAEPAVRTRLLELTYDPVPDVCREAAAALKQAAFDPAVCARLLKLTHG
jgi:HEAT repeat protein